MKTLFALLGLFMFASVSNTNVNANTVANNDEPVLTTEHGSLPGGKKALIILG
ncbi:MAG: hypothetical protein RBR78_09675 [Flavobacteriaceae bacterium]|jgi:hypothetical protein|nr:hypothetical protein [Flavobacteriaceae bacterium]